MIEVLGGMIFFGILFAVGLRAVNAFFNSPPSQTTQQRVMAMRDGNGYYECQSYTSSGVCIPWRRDAKGKLVVDDIREPAEVVIDARGNYVPRMNAVEDPRITSGQLRELSQMDIRVMPTVPLTCQQDRVTYEPIRDELPGGGYPALQEGERPVTVEVKINGEWVRVRQ